MTFLSPMTGLLFAGIAIPLLLLYEGAIWSAKFVEKKATAATTATPTEAAAATPQTNAAE